MVFDDMVVAMKVEGSDSVFLALDFSLLLMSLRLDGIA